MREPDLSDRTVPFTAGETVAVVEVMNGKIWTVRPVTVIKDSAAEIALWLAPGTVTRYPSGPQHGKHTVRQWMAGEWELIDRTWGPPGKLRLTRPGDPFEVWASSGMHDDGTPWYVNLQDPLRRVGAGFATMDHLLDILVAPDLRSWEWKDEAEFQFAQEAGLFSASRAAEIRAVGSTSLRPSRPGNHRGTRPGRPGHPPGVRPTGDGCRARRARRARPGRGAGTSIRAAEEGAPTMTQPLERFGTPEFMAPEMVLDPMNAHERRHLRAGTPCGLGYRPTVR